jgi:hypothetical protein
MVKTSSSSLRFPFCSRGLGAANLLAAVALAAVTATPAASLAGTASTTDGKASKEMVEEVKKSCITGDLGVTFVTKYFSRGIDLEDQGVIAQPYADLFFKVYDGGDTGFLNTVTLNLSVWSSLHSHHPGNLSTTAAWYEFDWTPGISVTFAKNFTLTTSYFEFDSPNDSFNIARSINVNLAYNDADLLGPFALHPHLTVLKELPGGGRPEGVAGLGPDGWYFEPGIAPTIPLVKGGAFPVTLTFPVTAGFGAQHFYAGDGFGYFSAGGQAAVSLGFIPSCLGAWTATVGATYYYLHDHLAEVDNGHHNDWVGSAAVGVTF